MPQISRRNFLVTAALATTSHVFLGEGQRIRVGCQANGFPQKAGDFPHLLDIVATMKTLGYTGFECNVRFVEEQFPQAADARKAVQATGMQFIGVHTGTPKALDDKFGEMAAGAASLGAANVVMSSSGLSPEGKFSTEALREKCDRLNALGKVCRQNGIQLAYHNHMPEFANNNAEIQGLADNTDPSMVKFLVDAGHGYQGGGDPAAFLLRNPRRVVGCHIKTFRNKTEQVPLGEGDFGFEALAQAIKKTNWSGWLIDEEGNQKGGDTAAVGPDREYIRRIFGV